MTLRDSGAALSVLSERVPVARLKGGVRGLSPVPSLTAGVADPEGTHKSPHVADARASLTPRGMGPLISRLKAGCAGVSRLPGQPCKSGGEGFQTGKPCTTTQPRREGCPANKGGRCPALSLGYVLT